MYACVCRIRYLFNIFWKEISKNHEGESRYMIGMMTHSHTMREEDIFDALFESFGLEEKAGNVLCFGRPPRFGVC